MNFDPAYRTQLAEQYPEEIVEQIADDVLHAPLEHSPGQAIPFVFTKVPDAHEPPILFVPGFGGGIINKASFAAELAMNNASIILPGQNRHKIVEDAIHGRNATVAQARNYLAVLDHTMGAEPVNIVAHSYGALIFQKMVELSPSRFTDSKTVFMAPSGSIHDETLPDLGRRWVASTRSEMNKKRPTEFPDDKGVTGKASAMTLLANLPRMKQEIGELAHARIDYPALVKRVGSLTIMSFAEDRMFPEDRMFSTLDEAVKAGATWLTPVSPDKVLDGTMRYSGDGAVHDDDQYNPTRVVGSLMQALYR